MSYDDPNYVALAAPAEPELPATRRYPICPVCGCNTLVMYSPPRDGLIGTDEGYRLYHEKDWQNYVDWNKAHLYCSNGAANCDVNIPVIGGMTTPRMEKLRKFVEVEGKVGIG